MRFVLGFAIPFGVVLCWGLADQWRFMSYRASNWAYFVGWSFALPVGVAWGVYALVGLMRPRRVFDLRAPHHVKSIAYGLVAGILAAATALVLLTWLEGTDLDGATTDDVVIGACAAVWTAVVLLILRPIRRGRCVNCGYDLQGITGPRCPECGLVGASDA